MIFKIAKPENHMSCGDLFFSLPSAEAESAEYEKIAERCRAAAKAEFGDNPIISERLEKELELLRRTESAFKVSVLCEIAALSRELGYPVCLCGEENGLLIMYLLGVSGVHPGQYGGRATPTDLVLAKARAGKSVSFELRVSERVREDIQRRLDEEFSGYDGKEGLYTRISLPGYDLLDQIGKVALNSGFDWSGIDLDDPELERAVITDICEQGLGWNAEDAQDVTDCARLYAYSLYKSKTVKDREHFDRVVHFVFRDDVFCALKTLGFKAPEAHRMSRLWSNGEKKEDELALLALRKAPAELVAAYRDLGFLRPEADCAARVNLLKMLRFYEIKCPAFFRKNESGDTTLRDPERIAPFLAEFAELWKKEPYMRFGQLVNVLQQMIRHTDDTFYTEDDVMLDAIRKEKARLDKRGKA
ncbi:MAG: hypothetical protein IK118_07800 [Clostridia bacterium]|nr:hypothetical protein [Clostridia bacterium]